MPQISKASVIETVRSPVVSAWQSAVAATEARERARAQVGGARGQPTVIDRTSAVQQATARAALAHAAAPAALLSAPPPAAAASTGQGLDFCARAYLALALAKVKGDAAAIAAAQASLDEFGACDSGWADALSEFLLHYTLAKHSDVPYRRWTDLGDFVLPDAIPAIVKIAVFGDWGTGEPRAQAMLRAIAQMQPDIVIHLGDIYYSCDAREADAFHSNLRAAFPDVKTSIFSLCGNHDLYSGGAPYFGLLTRLQQPASFFCLRNAHWQVLAMDTGYNDYDPFKEGTATTWVQDGTSDDGHPNGSYNELAWHADKLDHADGRKTILLSHHQLFTRSESMPGGKVRNDRLFAQLQPWLADITLWLWGHEHNQVIYQPFSGLERGRCIGAGAIPIPAIKPVYDASGDFTPGQPVPDLLGDPASRLTKDAATGLYDLGFAMLSLDGSNGSATYYGFNETAGARPVFAENLS